MGCVETRSKRTYERVLLEIDAKLLLNTLSLEAIKTSFFSIKNKKITYDEMLFCLKRGNVHYSTGDARESLRNLLNCFKISAECEFVEFYDFSQVLLLMILYSRNKFIEKYELIFDLFDEDKNEILEAGQVKELYVNILHIVLHFSLEMLIYRKLLERGSQIYEFLVKSTEETIQKHMKKFVFYVTKGNETVSRSKFVRHIKKFSLQEKILDFSSPQSIRRSIMPELFSQPK